MDGCVRLGGVWWDLGLCGGWRRRGGVVGSGEAGQTSNQFLLSAMRSLDTTLHPRLYRMGASCWGSMRTAIVYRMLEYGVDACCDDISC